MNRPFELPLPLLGLSIEERDTFYSLPWQTGTVDDIPLGNTSFLLNFGEVVDQTGVQEFSVPVDAGKIDDVLTDEDVEDLLKQK